MQVNLGMLIDALNAKFSLDIMADDWVDNVVTEIKVMHNHLENFKSNVLYIADCKVINSIVAYEKINVIGYNSAVLSSRNEQQMMNLFLINGKCSESTVINEVIDVIAKLPNAKFPVGFVDDLMKCTTLSDLCNVVFDFMHNPMILTDADGRMIGCSKEMMKDDACWEQLRSTFLASPDTVEGRKWSSLLRNSNCNGHAVFRLTPNGSRMLVCPVEVEGAINGFICIPEVTSHKIGVRNVEMTEIIRSVLIKDMQMFGEAGNSLFTGQENFLAALLMGHDISPVRISVMQKAMGIDLPDEYIYCMVIRKNEELSDLYTYKDIVKLIPESYRVYSVYYNYDVVLLLNVPKALENIEAELKDFIGNLLARKVSVGVSRPYKQLAMTQEYYKQAMAALKYGVTFDPQKKVHTYDSILLYHLLEYYPDQERIRDLCHPGILRLKELDRINGTTYLETFHKYIFSGRSLKKTADALYVHRNTVSYHIGKCMECLKVDLDDGEVLFGITFSLKVLDYFKLM